MLVLDIVKVYFYVIIGKHWTSPRRLDVQVSKQRHNFETSYTHFITLYKFYFKYISASRPLTLAVHCPQCENLGSICNW